MASSPASPSRSSSSDEKLAGTWTVPKAGSLPVTRRGLVPCAVTPSGRVCGTAIGMPCTLTVRSTPKALMSIEVASTMRFHW